MDMAMAVTMTVRVATMELLAIVPEVMMPHIATHRDAKPIATAAQMMRKVIAALTERKSGSIA